MRSDPARAPRGRGAPQSATQAGVPDALAMRAAGLEGGTPSADVAQLLARLEDTAWITAQAISVGRRRRVRGTAPEERGRRAPAPGTGAVVGTRIDRPAAADDATKGMLGPGARALLDALPMPVLWLDPRGVVRHCNASALARLGAPLLGQAWRDVVATRLAGLEPSVAVASNAFRNGQLVLLAPAAERQQPAGDGTPGAVSTAHPDDARVEGERIREGIRERIRERQLVRLGRVSAGLAHQLRTPIAATQLYLDLAAGSGDRSYLEKAQSSLDALTHHCESVLTLARGELRREPDVALGTLLALVQRQAQALRGKLQVEAESAPVALTCNPHLLAGALLNLVDNAMRASPGATALLVVGRTAGHVSLTVIDDGEGLPEALRARLGQTLPSSRPEGSGFGLAMANMIVEAHGGCLHIDSAPGRGTRVCVLLPTGSPCTLAQDESGNACARGPGTTVGERPRRVPPAAGPES